MGSMSSFFTVLFTYFTFYIVESKLHKPPFTKSYLFFGVYTEVYRLLPKFSGEGICSCIRFQIVGLICKSLTFIIYDRLYTLIYSCTFYKEFIRRKMINFTDP